MWRGNGTGCIPTSSTTFASHLLADFRLVLANPLLAGARSRESYTRGCMRVRSYAHTRAQERQATTNTFVHRCPRGHYELYRRSTSVWERGTGGRGAGNGVGTGASARHGTGSVGVGVGRGRGLPRHGQKAKIPTRAG